MDRVPINVSIDILCKSIGPKPTTVLDMWRMIWELGTNRIIMLTKEFENGKVSCDKILNEMYMKYLFGNERS